MVKRTTKTTGAAKKTTKSTESKPEAKPEDSNAAPAQATAPNGGTGEQMAPSMNVLAQYVKDLSFENPNAPNSLRPREKPPEISININVNPRSLSENDFEVELKLDAKAADGDEIMFVAELVYAGLFRITGVPKEAMQAAVLIECPRLLFPFARQILADATRNGNFPPLMIDPVDFAQLFRQRMEQQQAAAGNA